MELLLKTVSNLNRATAPFSTILKGAMARTRPDVLWLSGFLRVPAPVHAGGPGNWGGRFWPI